ncbi:unnamed protein product [Rhizophagus irregularis]|nr:unnamed protein product [Rhizophagus irregularis]
MLEEGFNSEHNNNEQYTYSSNEIASSELFSGKIFQLGKNVICFLINGPRKMEILNREPVVIITDADPAVDAAELWQAKSDKSLSMHR